MLENIAKIEERMAQMKAESEARGWILRRLCPGSVYRAIRFAAF